MSGLNEDNFKEYIVELITLLSTNQLLNSNQKMIVKGILQSHIDIIDSE